MYGRIILGYDDTDQARDALALTRLLASSGQRSIVLAHVIPRPAPFDSRTREYVQAASAHDHAVLDSALEALAGLDVESRPIESASPARGLHELAEEEGASLIVIGSTHRGPFGRVLLGSVGEMLLAGAPTAVAVAPKGFAKRSASAIDFVSAGFNHLGEGHAALKAAAALASDLGAKLRAITVDEGFAHARHPARHGRENQGSSDDVLDRALADAQAPDAERIALEGSAATCLAKACGESDLLVIGSRGYGPVRHTLLGSVSTQLMRSCPVPLVVVPRWAGASGPEAPTATDRLARAQN